MKSHPGSFVALLLTTPLQAADPGLTIYNQGFAMVRDTVPLSLQSGQNDVQFSNTTAHLEPDSVILRDPTGNRSLHILEQNYRGDMVSADLLLGLYEGKELDFLVERANQPPEVVRGRLIRAPYVFHQEAYRRYGQQYQQRQSAMAYPSGGQNAPIVEVNGQIRFSLPGQALFPPLVDKDILKPTLHWILYSDAAGPVDAELTYITGGMSWEADYNAVASAESDELSVVGWITMDNQSGKTFEDAAISLMAGDVNKLKSEINEWDGGQSVFSGGSGGMPAVTSQVVDEYHLYQLPRKTTLRDRTSKQVEFIHATNIESTRVYVYDGFMLNRNMIKHSSYESIRTNTDLGDNSNTKVWVMREFLNTEKNQLGVPLPRGRFRFYRATQAGTTEFIGENVIDHTPVDERVRIHTGNSFDLVGERRRTDFVRSDNQQRVDESFEIKLRNHKKEAVTIVVVEHMYRWLNWDVMSKSLPFVKKDSQTVEFSVAVPPGDEIVMTYTVRYTW